MAGDAVEERPRPEPAAVEVVAGDDVAHIGEQLFQTRPVPGLFAHHGEETTVPVGQGDGDDLTIARRPGLVAAEGGPGAGQSGGLGQQLDAQRARRRGPDESVTLRQGPGQGLVRGVLELGHGTFEPGVEEALVDDQAGKAQLLGDIGLVLDHGRGHVGPAHEEEVAVLGPRPGRRLPVIRIAAETAPVFDRRPVGRSRRAGPGQADEPVERLPGRPGRGRGDENERGQQGRRRPGNGTVSHGRPPPERSCPYGLPHPGGRRQWARPRRPSASADVTPCRGRR